MKVRSLFALFMIVGSLDAGAGPYDQAMSLSVQWLTSHKNSDGSWGDTANIQPVYTSVVVQALARTYNNTAAYYAGVAWLEDHAIPNVDLSARSAEALFSHGDSQSATLTYLQNTQSTIGSTFYGWGLSGNYTSSPLDTALALIAIKDLGSNSNVQAALNYLKSTQGTAANNQGWTIGNSNANSDPSVTAIVIQALARFTTIDTSLVGIIANGLNTLNSLLTSNSPAIQLAQAAQAAQDAGNATLATTFLNELVASPSLSGDGSWGEDIYITAIATRALATAAQTSAQGAAVFISDQTQQAAINKALGRNAMDGLNQELMAQYNALIAAGAAAALPKTVNVSVDSPETTSVPALPPLAMLILAGGLLALMQAFGQSKSFLKTGLPLGLLMIVMVTAIGNSYAQTAQQASIPVRTLQEIRAKGLSSSELQAIQKIGSNILQAKGSAVEEPGDRDLYNRVHSTVANLLKIENQGVGSSGLNANTHAQQQSALKKAQSAAWELVTLLRHESTLLLGSGSKPPHKHILSGGKQIGESRGSLYTFWANQLDSILNNQDTSGRLKQLMDLNNQLQPVTSISKRLNDPGSMQTMHFNSAYISHINK